MAMEGKYDGVVLSEQEQVAVDKFIVEERKDGATRIGFFGGRTVEGAKIEGDIDMLVVKPGVTRGGVTTRNGPMHVTHIPPEYKKDKLATFANQVSENAVWVGEDK